MTRAKFVKLAVLATVLLGTGVGTVAAIHSARQYYSGWHKHSKYSYHYRYYYKPTPTYAGYRHHYVVYHPAKPEYVYY